MSGVHWKRQSEKLFGSEVVQSQDLLIPPLHLEGHLRISQYEQSNGEKHAVITCQQTCCVAVQANHSSCLGFQDSRFLVDSQTSEALERESVVTSCRHGSHVEQTQPYAVHPLVPH
ncbi:hypothetical protein MPTK1_4g04380 [Marchantia polymorpha subsp. ruderalis]|uniref:Uncharacterized protein n=2 Tax=Marchantia polymorpha TaxID=3197 RepID=A0AAF6B6A4_MARPO|nr:hypothetical protein MARPO_0044s0035 [Marchantia polymorpha]BBN07538.1 hypothetical protein Mp_4g04380 [Marchantia polymorpha subsp. ruderalis]|eukprot:PTQ39562.1 hypothetical protein MARPO_0044s0035 [Marchantia polymorpha]